MANCSLAIRKDCPYSKGKSYILRIPIEKLSKDEQRSVISEMMLDSSGNVLNDSYNGPEAIDRVLSDDPELLQKFTDDDLFSFFQEVCSLCEKYSCGSCSCNSKFDKYLNN